jgi:uncharacterized membrane protein YphA (DoxX/SURF4 family)
MSGFSKASPQSDRQGNGRGKASLARFLVLGCRYVVAAVFLMAAASKITDLQEFRIEVLLHSGLPDWLGRAAVAVLPWLELTCGVCLAFGFACREAACFTALLALLFLAHSLLYPSEADCHCFYFPTPWTRPSQWWLPVRSSLLFAASAVVALAKDGPCRSRSATPSP